jgi:hypothetical protein
VGNADLIVGIAGTPWPSAVGLGGKTRGKRRIRGPCLGPGKLGFFLLPSFNIYLSEIEYILFVCLFLLFGTRSHCVAQAGLEFVILLPQSPECWD